MSVWSQISNIHLDIGVRILSFPCFFFFLRLNSSSSTSFLLSIPCPRPRPPPPLFLYFNFLFQESFSSGGLLYIDRMTALICVSQHPTKSKPLHIQSNMPLWPYGLEYSILQKGIGVYRAYIEPIYNVGPVQGFQG